MGWRVKKKGLYMFSIDFLLDGFISSDLVCLLISSIIYFDKECAVGPRTIQFAKAAANVPVSVINCFGKHLQD